MDLYNLFLTLSFNKECWLVWGGRRYVTLFQLIGVCRKKIKRQISNAKIKGRKMIVIHSDKCWNGVYKWFLMYSSSPLVWVTSLSVYLFQWSAVSFKSHSVRTEGDTCSSSDGPITWASAAFLGICQDFAVFGGKKILKLCIWSNNKPMLCTLFYLS